MTLDLTAASEALLWDSTIRARFLSDVSMDEPRPGTLWWLRARLVAIEQEAAARALDEVLSVEALARALHATGLNTIGKKPGSHGKYTGQCICNMDAAALIAALRGDR